MKITAIVGCMALATAAMGQTAPPIMRHSFDEGLHGWSGVGINCRASVATGSSFNGVGALKFEYDVKQGAFGMLTYAPTEGSLASAQKFRFWVRADQPTTVAFIVQEKGGGRFLSFFAPPRGKWQKVEVALGDLILSEGASDPKDADGRLDAARIESVVLGDVAQMVAQAGNQDIEKLLGVSPGARSLHLDDFTVTTDRLQPAVVARANETRLDTFARPQIGWMATGNATLARIEAGTPRQVGLQATYERAAGRVLALVRLFPKGTLKGMSRITFTASAQQATTLYVQVEEAGGGKFGSVCAITEAGADQPFTLELAGLPAGDDSPVKDRGVKPELITQIVFIDATALAGMGADGPNALAIRALMGRAGEAK